MKSFRDAIAEAVAFAEANPDKSRQHIGKYIRLPPEILATITVPSQIATVEKTGITFWIETMQRQEMLRNPLNAEKVILP